MSTVSIFWPTIHLSTASFSFNDLRSSLLLNPVNKVIVFIRDLDLDIFDCSNHDLIINLLENIGIKLARKVWYHKVIQQLVFLSDNGVIVDLVFWKRKGKNYFNYCEPGYVLRLPQYLVKEKTIVECQGNKYFLSSPPEKYLSALYGDDWRTPKVSKGNWRDDCKIISKKFDPLWHLYQKIGPFYLKIKSRLYPPPQVPENFFELNKNFWSPIPQNDKCFLVD